MKNTKEVRKYIGQEEFKEESFKKNAFFTTTKILPLNIKFSKKILIKNCGKKI